jgi:hypothetical protein
VNSPFLTSTSESQVDSLWRVCNIRQPLPVNIQLCIQLHTPQEVGN